MKILIWLILFSCPLSLRAQPPEATGCRLPLNRLRINSSYGYRVHPLSGRICFHAGIDLAARRDTVFTLMNGRVNFSGYNERLGLQVAILHGTGLKSIYGHLSECWVLRGDSISAGTPIGLTGATGRVTGEHLHFALKYHNRFLNPLACLKALLLRLVSNNPSNYAKPK